MLLTELLELQPALAANISDPLMASVVKPELLDHIRSFLSNGNSGSIGIAIDNFGHDGRIYDSQTADAVNLQLGVNNGRRVRRRTHFTSADRVVERGRVLPNETRPIEISKSRQMFTARERSVVESRSQLFESAGFAQRQGNFDSFDQHLYVTLVRQIIRINHWFIERVERS